MIKSKEEFYNYLEMDQIALGRAEAKRPKLIGDEIWKFQRLLRQCEYYINCKSGIVNKICFYYLKLMYKRSSMKLGFTIPLNVFGPGLSIAHYGTIVVNENAKIGKNCRIHEGVTIGATGGNPRAAHIGDNVFIGSGAKIIGDITIGNNIAIGANSVVVKNCTEDNITLAGIPAKKVSDTGSQKLLLIK